MDQYHESAGHNNNGESFDKLYKFSKQLCPVSGSISNLDSLLVEMEALMEDSNSVNNEAKDEKDNLEDELDDLTEKLKAAMESCEEVKESLGDCVQCKKEITDNSTLVGDKIYHKQCFTCDECGEVLENQYFTINGNSYCHRDKDVALPKCSVCAMSLAGQYVTVNGKNCKVNAIIK